ncbi:MAG: 3-phosphoshikimate 1-carboxyvinyltransferase [Chloroflexi bacterium]|nr:3-phosphoshikimate 1-carboxyvinyltransferase [Chloroflexota bacterium]
MKASIHKSHVRGKVTAPSSKSYTIRALMCAALAQGESEIVNPLDSDDTRAAVEVLSQVGVRVRRRDDLWLVGGGQFHQPEVDLFCGESATTLRFMSAVCSLVPGRCKLVTGPSLAKRPVKILVEALQQLGVNCHSQGDVAPIVVNGGRLRGGFVEMPGDVSSQFVSALLFIAPLAEEGVEIRLTTPLESKPYLLMTLECLEQFGVTVESSPDFREFKVRKQNYQPARFEIEGDWSSASYFLAFGALSGEVEVSNLNPRSQQGDRVLLDFLKEMGASIELSGNSVTVRQDGLKAIKADLSDCIDLLPTMAVLAGAADGRSEFSGIARARIKESNRVAAVKEGLERMGIEVAEEQNRLVITGSNPKDAVIDPKDDHRIAMAFSVLGSMTGETVINHAECVSKTYPEFWDVLKSIGCEVMIDG